MPQEFTKLLYFKQDVENALMHYLFCHDYKSCLFFVMDLFESGYETDTIDFLFLLYLIFYAHTYPSLLFIFRAQHRKFLLTKKKEILETWVRNLIFKQVEFDKVTRFDASLEKTETDPFISKELMPFYLRAKRAKKEDKTLWIKLNQFTVLDGMEAPPIFPQMRGFFSPEEAAAEEEDFLFLLSSCPWWKEQIMTHGGKVFEKEKKVLFTSLQKKRAFQHLLEETKKKPKSVGEVLDSERWIDMLV